MDPARHRRRRLGSLAFLLINPRSGDRRPSPEELAREAERLRIDAHVLREGEDAGEVARKAVDSGAEVLGVAGGDGSLAPLAAVALERDLPFVCVPLGTRNHFARDIGIDSGDPLAALGSFRGSERRVDVGFVGGRLFLNNVSLGLYASLVHDSEQKTRNRLVAFLRMAPAALGSSRDPLELAFEAERKAERRAVLVALVANNAYRVESLAELGERPRLDEGLLHAYVIEALSRRTLVELLFKAAMGDVDEAEGLVEWSAPRLTVDCAHRRLHAAIDGEPVILEAPLEFGLKPRALRVLVPPSGSRDDVE